MRWCACAQSPPLLSGQEQSGFLASLSELHENLALQHENRLHMARQFVYNVLTPLQLREMLLASGSYILNVPAALCSLHDTSINP